MAILGKLNERIKKITVTAGGSDVILIPINKQPTVTATPGGGGSALVEATNSSPEDVVGAVANWHEWASGTVTASTMDTVVGVVTALRLSATDQDAVFEITS